MLIQCKCSGWKKFVPLHGKDCRWCGRTLEIEDPAPQQQKISIGEETFEADVDMIPLLRELNRVGLHTTQHCIGHKGKGDESSYISIEISPDMDIMIRHDVRPRLVIRWTRKPEETKKENVENV